MKKETIRTELVAHLTRIGIARGTYVWQPQTAQLVIVIAGDMHTFTFKGKRGGMKRDDFAFQLGMLSGLAKAAGVKAKPKGNGQVKPADWNEPAQTNWIPA